MGKEVCARGCDSVEEMDWAVVGVVLAGLVAAWCFRRRKEMTPSSSSSSSSSGKIPEGSLGWPLIGETLEFIACGCASRPLDFMQKRRRLYGKVFKSHLLGRPVIVSTDAEVNKVVLQNDGRIFIPFYPKSVSEVFGKYSILQTNGSLHKRIHGLVGGFLKSHAFKERITREIENLLKSSFTRWKDGQQIYIQDEMKEITFKILVKVLLSIGPGEKMRVLKAQFHEFIKGIVSLPISLPGTTLHKSLKAKQRIMKLIKKIIEDKAKSFDQDTVCDVADVLIKEMKNDNGKHKLTVDTICANLTEMMIPGEETVPMLITVCLKYLSNSPSAMKQLLEENMELQRKKKRLSEPYSWMDYMSLSFTQNVISEALRMGNIINAAWRKALADVEIRGYLIPKGWCILASFTSVHLDEENYENPSEFNPWRWQDGSNQITFTPFGGGHRLCPGLEFSRLEVAIFLHHFVTGFSWVAEDDLIITFPTVRMKKRLPVTLSPISSS